MYNSIINIGIYSSRSLLEDDLKKVPELERFEHRFQSYDHLVADTIKDYDVVILDLPLTKEHLDLVYNNKKQDSLLILCLITEELNILTENDYKLIDDIWLSPLQEERLSFYFSKLQQHIKQTMDYELSQNYLDTLIDSIPDLVWFKDINGAHLKVNQSFCRIVGKTKEDVQGRSHEYIWDVKKEEYEKGEYVCLETEEAVIRAKKTCLFYEKVKCKEGLRQLRTYKSPIFDNQGKLIGTVGIAHDVTDLCNMNAEMQIILEHMPFAILFYDKKGTILNVNKKFADFFSICKESLIGTDYNTWELSLLPHIKGNRKSNNYELKIMLNSREKILKIKKEAILDIFNDVTGYFCVYSDITLEYNWKKEIIHCANTDYLTGLYNRRYLYSYLNEHRQSKPLGLFYIDIDNFKLINDLYGHKNGDMALIYVSKLMTKQFSKQQIFRLGGDEFIIAMNQSHPKIIKESAQQLLEGIYNCSINDEKLQGLSASIGIVIDDDPSISVDELIKRGDAALYVAKQRGKNQYYIWQDQ